MDVNDMHRAGRRISDEDFDDYRPSQGEARPADDWPELIEFKPRMPPPFPMDVLPPAVRAMVSRVSASLQVEHDLPAMLAFGALSTALLGKVRVHVENSWFEPPQLYIAVVLPPANLKSAAVNLMFGAIQDWAIEQRDAAVEEKKRSIGQAETRVAEAKALLRRALKDEGKRPDEAQRLQSVYVQAKTELDAQRRRRIAQLIVDDTTPEALAMVLQDNGGRAALVSAEGGSILTATGKQYGKSGVAQPDLALKAWSCDPVTVTRVQRDPIFLRSPSLAIVVTLQPTRLAELTADATLVGTGLLARFLLVSPRSLVGTRSSGAPPIPMATRDDYGALLRSLIEIDAQTSSATAFTLTLTADALLEFHRLWDLHEKHLGVDGRLASFSDFGGKLMGMLIRVAALLHMAEHGRDGLHRPISVDVVSKLEPLAHYFIEHALLAYGVGRSGSHEARARDLLALIRNRNLKRFAPRDIVAASPVRFADADSVREAASLLAERGYLRAHRPPKVGVGRPPGIYYEVRPSHSTTSSADFADSAEAQRECIDGDANGR